MIVFTGGGTGGHIYPAIEIARMARDDSQEISYVGSLRGQEGGVCEREGISFHGLPAEPLLSLKSKQGWVGLVKLLKATQLAKIKLKELGPGAVFSTGGYSAAPVMRAAKSLRIPLVIHESNSIPGRSNRMFASYAHTFNCTFRKTLEVIPGAVRNGQPIRRELRQRAVERKQTSPGGILVMGGSQGANFLNETVPAALKALPKPVETLIIKGKGGAVGPADGLPITAVDFLEANEMADAYEGASLVIGRSGGSLAEYAAFGLPSVLIPFPLAAGQHQLYNALEFQGIGAASVIEQPEVTPPKLASCLEEWLNSPEKRTAAKAALKKWDCEDASTVLWSILKGAAK